MSPLISGLLLINKPAGLTSNQVLGKVKALLGTRDLGHGGTLDSFATGVLPILCGDALKISRIFLENHPELPTYWKSYNATISLGSETDTLDPTGEVIKSAKVPAIDTVKLDAITASFLNKETLQTAPQYSAKKISGQRASDHARKGQIAELKPHKIFIKKLELGISGDQELVMNVTCSKGTYIRALARDIAIQLNTVGFVKTLQRTAVGDFKLNECESIDTPNLGSKIISFDQLIKKTLPHFIINSDQTLKLKQGKLEVLKEIHREKSPQFSTMNGLAMLCKPDQSPAALVEIKNQELCFLRGF